MSDQVGKWQATWSWLILMTHYSWIRDYDSFFGNCFLGILLFVKNRNKLITVVLWHVINGSILGFVLWWLIIYDSFKLHKVFWFGTHRLSHCLSPPNGRFRINCSEPVTITSRYMCQTKKNKIRIWFGHQLKVDGTNCWKWTVRKSGRSEGLKVDGPKD